jgi:HPt (histidine-containing phosphotransfer) domain-containing protein
MLERWIPKEKKEKSVGGKKHVSPPPSSDSLPPINGVDTAKGVASVGGTMSAYRQVLSLFCKDVEDRLPLLRKTAEENDTSVFATHVHALKSATASIGAGNISAQAAGLEAISKAGDAAFIRESLPDFATQLSELVKEITVALGTGKNSGGAT